MRANDKSEIVNSQIRRFLHFGSEVKGEQHKKIKLCYYLYIDIVIPKNIIKHTGLS